MGHLQHLAGPGQSVVGVGAGPAGKARPDDWYEQALHDHLAGVRKLFIKALPLLRSRSRSRGVSLWIRPLLLRLLPGVRAALALSLRARIACGVVGAIRREGRGRVAGPPRGVRPVPGVLMSGVLRLPGVGPALMARRKGVMGCRVALLLGVS